MSSQGVEEFIDKVLSDQAFQDRLDAEPDEALSQFDLTEDEIAAIKMGNEEQSNTLPPGRRR